MDASILEMRSPSIKTSALVGTMRSWSSWQSTVPDLRSKDILEQDCLDEVGRLKRVCAKGSILRRRREELIKARLEDGRVK